MAKSHIENKELTDAVFTKTSTVRQPRQLGVGMKTDEARNAGTTVKSAAPSAPISIASYPGLTTRLYLFPALRASTTMQKAVIVLRPRLLGNSVFACNASESDTLANVARPLIARAEYGTKLSGGVQSWDGLAIWRIGKISRGFSEPSPYRAALCFG